VAAELQLPPLAVEEIFAGTVDISEISSIAIPGAVPKVASFFQVKTSLIFADAEAFPITFCGIRIVFVCPVVVLNKKRPSKVAVPVPVQVGVVDVLEGLPDAGVKVVGHKYTKSSS
jgi:hypothetical protein